MPKTTYKNQLAKLFDNTCGANNGHVKYVGNVVYRPVTNGLTIRGEIIQHNSKPMLLLSAITRQCGEIDNIAIPLNYINQALDWYNGISDDEVIRIAEQIDNYIDAFRY